MFKHQLKTAWRALKAYKAYSLINVLGLTLGISACLVIFLVVQYELSYDQYHKKANRIYRVTLNAIDFNPSVSMAVVPALRTDFPELEQVTQVLYQQSGLVKIGATKYEEEGFAFADHQFTSVFDYEWLAGNSITALSAPNSVVLTETIAKKWFGKTDPMGQLVNLENGYNLKVTGLIKDLPGNTHLPFNFLVSFETIRKEFQEQGSMSAFYAIHGGSFAYIVTPPNMNRQQLQQRIPGFIAKNWGENIAKEARLPLQPLTDIHFDQRYLNNTISNTTSREIYWALAAVAVFIIIIACINFINLATAQAIRRAKEIGVRKVLGSSRSQLILQFIGETALMVITALLLSLAITALLLPMVAGWLDVKVSFMQLIKPSVAAMVVAGTLIIILLAGLYPAFLQSGFNAATSLKSRHAFSYQGFTLRKCLVVLQFAISQVMIVGTLVVAYQMDFFKNQRLGFNKNAVISIPIQNREKGETLKQELLREPGIKSLSYSSGAPVYNNAFTSFQSPEAGITKDDVTEMKFIDEAYIDLFDLKLLAGEKIRRVARAEKDTQYNVVVNETMMHKLGIQDPRMAIGRQFTFNGGHWYATITGIVQDFQSESKHKKIRPCVLMYEPRDFYTASIKLQPYRIDQTIARIDKLWSAQFPDNLFSYEFIDDHIASWYRQEQKEYTAFRMFSAIAILIGCLGLYGLVSFAAAQRIKEVGIRKVLGASLSDIIALFSREFVLLIIVAFVIAAPVAYLVMQNWLKSFAYQVSIGGGIFLIAIASSFIIAALTISYQAIKAGLANPVNSLRTE